MLYHHLKSFKNYKNVPMHFHKYPEYGMFSSASQVQLDVYRENLVKTINVFSKIEPIKALLFSNSVLFDENKHLTCFRDALWEYSTHGVNPHNIGMYDVDFKDLDDLQAYMESLNIYCVMRDGAYINFPSMNLLDYFSRDSVCGEIYCNGEYRKIDVRPCISDIKYLRPFKFINLTFRGTVEFRSVCTQPIRDSMCVAAFHLGLKDRLDELEDLINNDNVIYHKGYTAGELRKLLIQDEIPAFINKKDLCTLSKNVVDLAYGGLEDRGIGEEIFLNPLYERIKRHTNPGRQIIDLMHKGIKLEKIIRDYGNLSSAV
jgi:gamma-glutamylcysteine synthetase